MVLPLHPLSGSTPNEVKSRSKAKGLVQDWIEKNRKKISIKFGQLKLSNVPLHPLLEKGFNQRIGHRKVEKFSG
jgi:hypothetical protein